MYQDTMWQDFSDFCVRFDALSELAKNELCEEILGEHYDAAYCAGFRACVFEELMRGNFDEQSIKDIFAEVQL